MFTKKKFARRSLWKQYGISLAEIAIVLGIMGVVTYGVWSMVSQGWEQTRREQAEEAIAGIVRDTRAFYAGRDGIPIGESYVTTTHNLLKSHVIPGNLLRNPDDCKVGTCIADTPWGSYEGNNKVPDGTLHVCGWELGNTSDPCYKGKPAGTLPYQFFGVTLLGLNMGSCIALANKISSTLGPPGLIEVNINGCNLSTGNGCKLGKATNMQPIKAENLNAECGKTKPAHVTFVYRMMLPTN
ncbi:MAG: hypothetical protein ABTQ34_04410 [Bdellovibrionales bacterium]